MPRCPGKLPACLKDESGTSLVATFQVRGGTVEAGLKACGELGAAWFGGSTAPEVETREAWPDLQLRVLLTLNCSK